MTRAGVVRVGGAELIRVVVRRANFDKIAHKIDKMGDTSLRLSMRTRESRKLIRHDEDTIAKLNAERATQFVTVRDDVDLAMIRRFGYWPHALHPRHPILLKDVLDCRASVSDASGDDGVSQKTPDRLSRDAFDRLNTVGSLLCDGNW